MFDYTHVMTARKEYEARNHMDQDAPGLHIAVASPLRQAAAGIGQFLVAVGSRLQAQAGAPEQPTAGTFDTL